jgi:adenine phosphoribosyltransferase
MLITHFMNHIYTVTMPRANVDRIDVIVGLDARGFLIGSVLPVVFSSLER